MGADGWGVKDIFQLWKQIWSAAKCHQEVLRGCWEQGSALGEPPQAEDSEPSRSEGRYWTFHSSFGTRIWGICPQRTLDMSKEFCKESKEKQ